MKIMSNIMKIMKHGGNSRKNNADHNSNRVKSANNATQPLPMIAAGSKSLSFADLIKTAFTANPVAVIKAIKSPKIFPNCSES